MFTLSILTPEKRFLTDQEIEEVIVPGDRGQLDVLPGHAPLVSTLGSGVLHYRLKGENAFQSLAVSWGYMEVHPDGVVVLAEEAELPEDVDRALAEAALKKAQHALAQLIPDPEEIEKYQRDVERAQAQLELLDQLSH